MLKEYGISSGKAEIERRQEKESKRERNGERVNETERDTVSR